MGELAHNAGVFSPVRYYGWSLDLSGSPQGGGGVGGLVFEIDALVGQGYFPTYDGNGNLTNLVKASDSSVVATYEYGPFGKIMGAAGVYASENPWRFSTKYADEETGFVSYELRYYDSENGRWLTEDPIGESGGMNLRAILNNDTVNKTDFLGLLSVDDVYGEAKDGARTVQQQLSVFEQYNGAAREAGLRLVGTFVEWFAENAILKGTYQVQARWKRKVGKNFECKQLSKAV